jgi:acetate kinase
VPLAPLHQPHNLAPIRILQRRLPDLPQVACFDTAFHRTMPEAAARIPIPRAFHDQGIRRYGFHGLSYEHVARRLAEIDPALSAGRVIAAHLGNGASLCAMRNGRSVDTTMGFTALDGLVMGTRCGSVDPGALLYLQQAHGLRAVDVEHMLYHESGLLGVSGISHDMRILQASADPHAKEAIELFVYRLIKEVGALTSVLGGLDALVFSAGIGEHSAGVRAAVCERLAWLGVECDAAANARHDSLISTSRSPVRVFVIATDEEAMLAEHTAHTLAIFPAQ